MLLPILNRVLKIKSFIFRNEMIGLLTEDDDSHSLRLPVAIRT